MEKKIVYPAGGEMIINADYKIESDAMNVTLFVKKKVTGTGRGKPTIKKVGEEYWLPEAYFSSPQNAMDYLINKEIMGSGMKDLKTVVKKVEELTKLMESLKMLPHLSLRVL